jgi:hypothetical protein
VFICAVDLRESNVRTMLYRTPSPGVIIASKAKDDKSPEAVNSAHKSKRLMMLSPEAVNRRKAFQVSVNKTTALASLVDPNTWLAPDNADSIKSLTLDDLDLGRGEIVELHIPYIMSRVLIREAIGIDARGICRYKDPTETLPLTLYYFEQYSAIIFPPHGATTLIAFMFYTPPNEHESSFGAQHVSDLGTEVPWVLVLGLWVSRCGKIHVLVLEVDLLMRLVEIDGVNPWRAWDALPFMYVDHDVMREAVERFMTNQSPDSSKSMVWDPSRNPERPKESTWTGTNSGDDEDGDVRHEFTIICRFGQGYNSDDPYFPAHIDGVGSYHNSLSHLGGTLAVE